MDDQDTIIYRFVNRNQGYEAYLPILIFRCCNHTRSNRRGHQNPTNNLAHLVESTE